MLKLFLPLTSSFYSSILFKVRILKLGGVDILAARRWKTTDLHNSPSASSDLALSLCRMPFLTNLELDNVLLHDEFFSSLRSESSSMKVSKTV